MYKNDRTRKEILVDFGFRLPSALDNRPLTFEEFEATVHQAIYLSATPGPYELERSQQIVEQLIRPTGIVDPVIHVRPTEGQIDDLMEEIRVRVERGERSIVTTLTKRMAEDLADYLRELGVKVQYLHAEVDTLERVAILRDLRLGVFDVIVGINLLREGIDLPEVTLVAILDADKEGFLRSAWSLIQMIGRAARNIGGEVVMYADTMTESMKAAIGETDRRRAVQERLQPGAGDRAADDRQGHPRPQRPAPVRRRGDGRLRLRARGARRPPGGARHRRRSSSSSRGWRRRCGPPPRSSSSSGRPRSATRSSRSGSGSCPRTSRWSWPAPPRRPAMSRPASHGGTRSAAPSRPVPSSRSRRSRSWPPARSRPAPSPVGQGDEDGDGAGTASDWLPGHPRRARGPGGLAGPLARPADLGPDGHPEHPEADRHEAAPPPLIARPSVSSTAWPACCAFPGPWRVASRSP